MKPRHDGETSAAGLCLYITNNSNIITFQKIRDCSLCQSAHRICLLTGDAIHRHIPTLSIILLTHATPAHLAAFAHCCKHFPLFQQIPIYATSPVISLGRSLLQDIYASTPLACTVVPQNALAETSYSYQSSISDEDLKILLQPPTSEEIERYFSLIHPLKYSQPHQPLPSPFSPPLNDLTITAYNAGHTLGGTIWHIQHGMESIVYAVDWNQIRENVVAGAWVGGSGGGGTEVIPELRNPTALICSARGADKPAMAGGRKKRDDTLIELVRATVAKGGSILIPTDTSARVLELAYVLEHAWRKDMGDLASEISLKKAKLYLASKNAGATMRHVRSMLEWMDENVVKEFESEATVHSHRQHKRGDSRQTSGQGNTNHDGGGGTPSSPFEFQYLKMLESRKRIEKVMSRGGPKIILASDASLEWGFSKDLLGRIATGSSNLVVLTNDASSGQNGRDSQSTTCRTLCQWYKERKDGVATEVGSDGVQIEVSLTNSRGLHISDPRRTPLEGKELLIYQQYLATRRQSQNLSNAGMGAVAPENSADAVDETSSTSSSSSEESDPEKQGKALNVSAKTARFNRNKTEPSKGELGINVLIRQPRIYDYDVRGKKGRDQMFPFINKRRRADDFGELIKPEEYLRAEERDDLDGQDMKGSGLGKPEGLGQKRKWQDTRQSGTKPGDEGSNKRRQRGGMLNNQAMTNGNINHHMNGNGGQLEDESSDGSNEEPEEDVSVPSKLLVGNTTIASNYKIAYVDFTGLHDQRSLFMLIPLIRPKKLVLTGGSLLETTTLAEYCKGKLQGEQVDGKGTASYVFTPSVAETVDVSVDTNAWTVKLSEALVRRFHWQNVRGLGVVTLMGQLAATIPPESVEEPDTRKKLKTLKGEAEEFRLNDVPAASEKASELAPTLNVIPANMAAATRSVAQPLHVGDLRLADLRKVLQSTGHTAEFPGEGTLLIDGLVAVRKSGTGKIEVESGGRNLADMRVRSLEGSFYAVKRKIYEGLAVIAGG